MTDNLILFKEIPKGCSRYFIHEYLWNMDTGELYKRDMLFKPIKGSIYSKPSFAGRQVELGILNGEIIYSNGVWFYEGIADIEYICDKIEKGKIVEERYRG